MGRPFPCNRCSNNNFRTEIDLKDHEVLHDKRELFTCIKCNASFRYQRYLINHEKSVHKPIHEGTNFPCHWIFNSGHKCDKSFSTISYLDAHIDGHNSAWPFQCRIC